MTATFLTIADAPLEQTVAIVRESLDAVLVWEPRRWVRDVPADAVTARLRDAVRNPRADHEDVDS